MVVEYYTSAMPKLKVGSAQILGIDERKMYSVQA